MKPRCGTYRGGSERVFAHSSTVKGNAPQRAQGTRPLCATDWRSLDMTARCTSRSTGSKAHPMQGPAGPVNRQHPAMATTCRGARLYAGGLPRGARVYFNAIAHIAQISAQIPTMPCSVSPPRDRGSFPNPPHDASCHCLGSGGRLDLDDAVIVAGLDRLSRRFPRGPATSRQRGGR